MKRVIASPDLLSFPKRQNINTGLEKLDDHVRIGISVDCVIFGFDENELKVLLIKCDLKKYEGMSSLLGDLVGSTEDLEEAAYRILNERTGLDDVYLEQVKAFGKIDRHPAARVITIVYCSLINVQHHKLGISANELHWHPLSSLKEMAFDHKNILDVCHCWLQKRIQEHPLGFSLLPKKFSLRELQNLYEAILVAKLDRRNFRKKFFSMDLLIDTGEYETDVPHRPGKLYRFNYEKYHKKEQKKWLGIDF
ncbi:MAG: NUDIX domain-containing protein [Chitinophagaceae bacterium]